MRNELIFFADNIIIKKKREGGHYVKEIQRRKF